MSDFRWRCTFSASKKPFSWRKSIGVQVSLYLLNTCYMMSDNSVSYCKSKKQLFTRSALGNIIQVRKFGSTVVVMKEKKEDWITRKRSRDISLNLLDSNDVLVLLFPGFVIFVSLDSLGRHQGMKCHQTLYLIQDFSWDKFYPLFLCSTGTGCPGRLWSLLLWRYSRPAWTRSSTTYCRWPCFGRRGGLDDPWGPFQPLPLHDSVIL